MIDVGIAVDRFSVPATYTTFTSVIYDDYGNAVKSENAPVDFNGCFQHVSGRDLLDLEEGVRREAVYSLWTRVALKIDDHVHYGGVSYRIKKAHIRHLGNYNKYILGRLA